MSYNVVFEYDKNTEGHFGFRTWTSYTNEAEFNNLKHPNQNIIAKNVSQEEAVDLTSLTPEICRYMAAIEEYFDIHSDCNAIKLYEKLKSIREFAIMDDRKTIFYRDWERINAKPFIKHFKKMAERNPSSIKSFAIVWVLSTIFDEDTGEVI